MDSIERNDLWRGIVARKATKGYQIAFGHHRLEAIKRLGIARIDIDVADLSDAQMLQYLSDENLNQGGKSPAAVREIVVRAIFMLEGYLKQAKTPEEFCELANIEFSATGAGGAGWRANDWARIKNAKTVGKDILRPFLSTESHSSGWSNENIQMGIKVVHAERAFEDAKAKKEAAQEEFKQKVGKVSEKEEEAIQERLRTAEKDREEAERFAGYNDIIRMFPTTHGATAYVRELQKHYPDMPKSEQLQFARRLISNGTGYRDIPRVLGEMVKGKKAWAKEEKARARKRDQDSKKRRDSWKAKWQQQYSMTPDEYTERNIAVCNTFKDFVKNQKEIFEYIEQESIQQEVIEEFREIYEMLAPFVHGLPSSNVKVIN